MIQKLVTWVNKSFTFKSEKGVRLYQNNRVFPILVLDLAELDELD